MRMHRFSRIHCSSCSLSFPVERCGQRNNGCRQCVEARHRFGSIEVDIHECPSCSEPAGYALLNQYAQAELQSYSHLSFGFYKKSTFPDQDRIHLFSRWLAKQSWWVHNREHIEAVLNVLTCLGDPAGFTEFLEYLWKTEN